MQRLFITALACLISVSVFGQEHRKIIDLSKSQEDICIPISSIPMSGLTAIFNVSNDSIYMSIQNHRTWDLQSGSNKQIHAIMFVEQFYGSGSGVDFATSLYGSISLAGDDMDMPIAYSYYIGDFAWITSIKQNEDKTFTIKGLAYQDESSDPNKINGEHFDMINVSIKFFETEKVLLTLNLDDDYKN